MRRATAASTVQMSLSEEQKRIGSRKYGDMLEEKWGLVWKQASTLFL